MEEKQNLLVIDWDFFFPDQSSNPDSKDWQLYDWGHSETWGSLTDALWVSRAAAFDANNIPRPGMNDEWRDFWRRFDIDMDAVLYYADSNVQAMAPDVAGEHGSTGEVWLFDAHHDSGYHGQEGLDQVIKEEQVSCEDWMIGYALKHNAELHVRYPRWKRWAFDAEPVPPIEVDRQFDDGELVKVPFDTVFVCRSGTWVPPWEDEKFWDFVMDAPVAELYDLTDMKHPRDWNEEEVNEHIEGLRALAKQFPQPYDQDSDQ